jgi:alpha-L-fucosidase
MVPGLKNKVISAKLMGTGASLKTSSVSTGVNISLPAVAPDAIDSVLKLELKGKVADRAASTVKKEMKSGELD